MSDRFGDVVFLGFALGLNVSSGRFTEPLHHCTWRTELGFYKFHGEAEGGHENHLGLSGRTSYIHVVFERNGRSSE